MRDRLAVIGAGLMGAGLAHLFAKGGWQVSVYDPDVKARARLENGGDRIAVFDDPVLAVAGASLVIEAAYEDLALKQSIMAGLIGATGSETLIATNSSVISVGEITRNLPDQHAWRVMGTHFWNPPELIPLVEVIPGPRTQERALTAMMEILRAVGKEPVRVHKDVVPGNRLQHALWREAIALVEEGVCSPSDVDQIVKRSFGLRLPVLGPLENADLVGLDLTLQIHNVVLSTLSNAGIPSSALVERVKSGKLGVKSGEGFYKNWTADGAQSLRARLSAHLHNALRPGAT